MMPCGVGRPIERVQSDHAVGRQIEDMLHKSVVIRGAVKLIKECIAPVVVAQHRDHADRHIGQDIRQSRVLIGPTMVRQIAHQHNRFGVTMMGQRVTKNALQSRHWVKPDDRVARACDMQVRDQDKFRGQNIVCKISVTDRAVSDINMLTIPTVRIFKPIGWRMLSSP